jgi:hypothetical protein
MLLAGVTIGLLALGVGAEAAYVGARSGPTTAASSERERYRLLMEFGFRGAIVSGLVLFVVLMGSAARGRDGRDARGFDVIQ